MHGNRDNARCVRRPGLRELASILTVTHVKRDKGSPKLLSAENDTDPGPVLLCLEGLTQVEQMLIVRGCPVMCVYRKKGGQRGYKNHVLNFPRSLPTYVSDLPFLVVMQEDGTGQQSQRLQSQTNQSV